MAERPVALWGTGLVSGLGLDGGFGDLDVEAEGLELAEVGADLAVAVGLAVVPAGAEVAEPGAGVGQQVPDDDEDGPAGRALGADAADAPGEAAEPLAEEGVGAGRAERCLGAVALEVGVAVPLGGLAGAGAGLAGDGGESGPGREVGGGREAGHVQARFGDDRPGEVGADAGDLGEPPGGGQ